MDATGRSAMADSYVRVINLQLTWTVEVTVMSSRTRAFV